MKQAGIRQIKTLAVILFMTGIFSLQVLAKETTKVIQTNDFAAFSEATARLIQEEGSSVQSSGVRDTSTYAAKRLIVKSRGGSLDLQGYGAETVIQGPSGYYVMQFATKQETEACLKKLQQRSDIEYVEPDGYDSVGELEISDAIEADSLESAALSEASSSHNSWGVEHIDADQYAAYLQQTGYDTGIRIAVVDSGVWNGHSMLQNCTTAGYDYVDGDNNPFNDGHGHGTHVAGIIVDCMSGLKVDILAVRVLADDGYGSHINVANGIRYAADNGAKVINVSIGGGHSEYKDEAVRYAISKGAAVVIAAGNESSDVEYSCPGHVEEGIVVAAIDDEDVQTWFSNYGSSIDVAAPGQSILSCGITGATSYVWMSGTSMAAPHVTAAAAMYRLRYTDAGPVKTQELVKRYCEDLGSTGWDEIYGSGLVKMSKAMPKMTIAKPTLGTATAIGTSQVKVTWSRISDADGYRVYRRVPGGTWIRLKTIAGNSTSSYTDTTVEPGKKYSYTVRAYKKSGAEIVMGEFDSNGLTVITGLDTPVLKSATCVSYNSINVTWTPVTNAMGYRIYRRETSSTLWRLVGRITRQSSSSFVDKTAVTGTQYHYTVRATCAYDGVLKASAYQSPGVIGKAVLDDTAITAIGNSDSGIKMVWNKVSGATGYTIYRSTSSSTGFTKVKTIQSAQTTSWTDSGVTAGKTYYYKLRAYLYINQKYVYSSFTTVRQVAVPNNATGSYAQEYERLLRQCEQKFLYSTNDIVQLKTEAQQEFAIWEEEIEKLNQAVEKQIGAARYLLYDSSYRRWIADRDAKAAQRAAQYMQGTEQWIYIYTLSQIESTKTRCEWIIKTYLN
ncbi:MAG: S8 family serine peptidase [Lachnospiraceae bacterium]|nr:S8 family serine peptidase [Robinsoniella sp.]MDY3767505.1 S8 family serine peptidase [Lachnospiraceae bacterium]